MYASNPASASNLGLVWVWVVPRMSILYVQGTWVSEARVMPSEHDGTQGARACIGFRRCMCVCVGAVLLESSFP